MTSNDIHIHSHIAYQMTDILTVIYRSNLPAVDRFTYRSILPTVDRSNHWSNLSTDRSTYWSIPATID